MPHSFSSGQDELSLARRPSFKKSWIIIAVAVALFMVSTPVFALWLPWATEEAKIKKTVDDIWQALLTNDRVFLVRNLTGARVSWFIDWHRNEIRQLGIKALSCNFKTITIDSVQGSTAWVTYQRVATLKDGSQIPTDTLAAMKKVNGYWKLVTDLKSTRQQKREDERDQAAEDENPDPLSGSAADSLPGKAPGGR